MSKQVFVRHAAAGKVLGAASTNSFVQDIGDQAERDFKRFSNEALL